VSPHYDRNFAESRESLVTDDDEIEVGDPIEGAAEALREAEIESAQPDKSTAIQTTDDLDAMSIDELRKLASTLNVPNREQVVSRDKLINAIRGGK
jgi:hypothetical protein